MKAQVDTLEGGGAPHDDSLEMAGMFADALGIACQLLVIAPGVQVVRPGEGTALAREANDFAADAFALHPRRFSALAGFPHDVWLHTMGLAFSSAFDRFFRNCG